MRLHEWVAREGHGAVRRLSEVSGVSYTTVRLAAKGMVLERYDVAKAISDATGGAVTVADLCEPPGPVEAHS